MSILRLKKVLADKSVTGKELAAKVGVTENAISMIINNRRQPRFELLLNMANALDVDIRELFNPTKLQKTPQEILRDAINNLEVVYAEIDKPSS